MTGVDVKTGKLSRREFLSAAVTTAAGTYIPIAAGILGSEVQRGSAQAIEKPLPPSPLLIEGAGYRLGIDKEKGRIAFMRCSFGVERELLIPHHGELPLFRMEFYMPEQLAFQAVDSSQARRVKITKSEDGREQLVAIDFANIADLPLNAHVTIRCPAGENLTYWNLELDNGTSHWIGHIQFPVVRIPFDDLSAGGASHLLWSFADGSLASPVVPDMLVGPWGGRERDTTEIWRRNNYPGEWTSTQLMAYYNDAGGLYVACDDATGLPKFIDPMLEADGVTMALGHYPGTQGPGKTRLAYNVVLGTFQGDWYAAAEIYRKWSAQQEFLPPKMARNPRVPQWLKENLTAVAFPMRGQGDWDPPAAINPEYTPATHAVPYLEKIAAGFGSPLMPIAFNWEHSGPWVQPESFPPVGGEAGMKEYMRRAKEKGWHPAIYGDGLFWVISQKNTDYDGVPYFKAHGGEAGIARRWDGQLLGDVWDWRKHYVVCVATEKGRQMVLDTTRQMAEFGPDMVQQFDQSPGPRVCYATDHGHPPVPGPWMTAAFQNLIEQDAEIARIANPKMAMSCEGAPPEIWLQNFQTWDSRGGSCPLFAFLYHEYAHGFQGFRTDRVNDEALRLSVGRSLVNGYIANYTLRDKGQIGFDWNDLWTRAVPDQVADLDWGRRANEFRSGVARDYLIFGKMLRPWKITNITKRDYGQGQEPLVQSATWQAPSGRVGTVIANCADMPDSPQIEIEGQGSRTVVINVDGQRSEKTMDLPAILNLRMEPRSLVLIEVVQTR